MSHQLAGIVTSFKIKEDVPHVVLVGNYCFIPTDIKWQASYKEKEIAPFRFYTKSIRKRLKELSFTGPCAYLETHFFVEGSQMAEVWNNGAIQFGPALSFHGYTTEAYNRLTTKNSEFFIVDKAINQALAFIGIFCRDETDEFDSARLGDYRSNNEMIKEYEMGKIK